MRVEGIDYPITDMDEFMRSKPIKPQMSLMDERRELLDKVIKLQSKEIRLQKDTIRLEKLQSKLRDLENEILLDRNDL